MPRHAQNDEQSNADFLQLHLSYLLGWVARHEQCIIFNSSSGTTWTSSGRGTGLTYPSSFLDHPYSVMSTGGGWASKALRQIKTCSWALNKFCMNPSSVGGKLGRGGAAALLCASFLFQTFNRASDNVAHSFCPQHLVQSQSKIYFCQLPEPQSDSMSSLQNSTISKQSSCRCHEDMRQYRSLLMRELPTDQV